MTSFPNIDFYKKNSTTTAVANLSVGNTPASLTAHKLAKGVDTTFTCDSVSGDELTISSALAGVVIGDVFYTNTGVFIGVASANSSGTTITMEKDIITTYIDLGVDTLYKVANPSNTLSATESFYMVDPVVNGTGDAKIFPKLIDTVTPEDGLTFTDNSLNNIFVKFNKVSVTGSPDSPTTVVEIPAKLTRVTPYQNSVVGLTPTAFVTTDDFPTHVWYLVNPYGSASTTLNASSKFSFVIPETLPSLEYGIELTGDDYTDVIVNKII